jgi:hypothetical protein
MCPPLLMNERVNANDLFLFMFLSFSLSRFLSSRRPSLRFVGLAWFGLLCSCAIGFLLLGRGASVGERETWEEGERGREREFVYSLYYG